MLRTAFLTFLTLLIAIGGGAGSVWYALGAIGGLGALHVGGWTAYPQAGTVDADPYSKARVAREAELPLGRAEGLAFVADRDSTNQPLRRDCTYRIEGHIPAARFWTIYAADAGNRALAPVGDRAPGISAFAVVRASDNSVVVTASPRAAPMNWLAISGQGGMSLVLTLYDTPVASNENIAEIDLPQVLRTECDG
ncbi:MAG: DUF1214 domain-containing protein [Mesorhizobium sp.]|nr:DUF1214 domain-containing protein [Mesorhizobium sp.]